MRTRTGATLGLAVLLASACGGGDGGNVAEPAPVETVTVTETVTASPEPDGTETDTAPPAEPTETAGDVCDREGLEQLAFIFVTSPSVGAEVDGPLEVEGCANTFEANILWRLLDRDGAVLVEGQETASCGTGCVGTFSFTIDVPETDSEVATLEVYDTSAKDGSVVHLNAIPIVLSGS